MTPRWFTRELGQGDAGPDVDLVARKLGSLSSSYDDDLAARVRGVQLRAGLPVSGLVDEATAAVLGERARAGLRPDWYGTPEGAELVAGWLPDSAAVRRFQSQHGLPLTGEVDERTAVMVADVYAS